MRTALKQRCPTQALMDSTMVRHLSMRPRLAERGEAASSSSTAACSTAAATRPAIAGSNGTPFTMLTSSSS